MSNSQNPEDSTIYLTVSIAYSIYSTSHRLEKAVKKVPPWKIPIGRLCPRNCQKPPVSFINRVSISPIYCSIRRRIKTKKSKRNQAVIFALYRTKVQINVHAVFGRDPEIFAQCALVHVFNVPLPSLLRIEWIVLFCFFWLEMWDPVRPKNPKKCKNPNIWRT